MMNFHSLESTTARADCKPARPIRALAAEEDRAQVLERRLLLMFVAVAAISVGWHLGTSLQWLWTSCISQLHYAVTQAGAF